MDYVSVKYIGKRSSYVDGAFGTRVTFKQGESKMIPADKALLMLRHPDVYVPGKADAPIAVARRRLTQHLGHGTLPIIR